VLELAGEPHPHLHVIDPESDPEPSGELADRILAAIAQADRPLSRDALRQTLGIRNATLGEVLARLRAERRIERLDRGFVLDR
jgi:chromosome segregation and condensation protein ScpB